MEKSFWQATFTFEIRQLQDHVGNALGIITNFNVAVPDAIGYLTQLHDNPVDAPNWFAAHALDIVNQEAYNGQHIPCELLHELQDIIVLCCSRSLDHNDIEGLKQSFKEAFLRNMEKEEDLVSKLLNARWQLFVRDQMTCQLVMGYDQPMTIPIQDGLTRKPKRKQGKKGQGNTKISTMREGHEAGT